MGISQKSVEEQKIMAKLLCKDVVVDGQNYHIEFNKKGSMLTINGTHVPIDKNAKFPRGVDLPIQLGGREAHLVITNGVMDVAIDGVFVGTGKPYVPLQKLPWWGWIFYVLNGAIPVVALGGAIPIALAAIGIALTSVISTSSKMNIAVRILLCVLVVVAMWALFLLILGATIGMTSNW